MKQPEVVVITGASAGVGRATVRAFARQGAHLGLISRNLERLQQTRDEVVAAGGKAVIAQADVADPEQVEGAAEAVERAFGPIDVWINNAMVSVFSPFMEITPEEFRRVTEVTYLGYVYGTHAALKRMVPRDRGVIVQVGSALAHRAIPLQSAYCGAKHAIQGFTEAVRCELLHEKSNVRLTMVQLPAVNTPQFRWVRSRLPRKPQPVPPIYQPEVAAEAIQWAAHHHRREPTLGMMNAALLVGNKFAPALGDHYLAWTGYESQMTEEPADPQRPDNLWTSPPGDVAAHGDFDACAYERSLQWELNKNRRWIALAAMGAGAAAWALRSWTSGPKRLAAISGNGERT